MKVLYTLILCSICFLQTSIAQPGSGAVKDSEVNNNYITSNFVNRTKSVTAKLEGTPMLFEEDLSGYIILKNNVRSKLMKVNYDLIGKSTTVTVNGKQFSVDNNLMDSLIVINKLGPQVFRFIDQDDDVKLMQIMVDGEYPLLKLINASLVRPNYNAVLQTGNKYHTIKRRYEYFLLDGNEALSLPGKSKKIASSKKFNPDFKSLVKNSSPKMSNEKSLVKFFSMINSHS